MTEARIEQLLTVSEVSEWMRVHRNTLKRWVYDGRIACYKVGSRGDLRFKPADVRRFLDAAYTTDPSQTIVPAAEILPMLAEVEEGSVWDVKPGSAPTKRELECLAMSMLYGRDECSLKLGISAHTVSHHLSILYLRLGAGTKEEAALALGWLKIPSQYVVA